ncbi:hypothetical protein G7Y89_g2217 [Cudoniella acicularis]|uniref:Uncharacterized protein n=1 Tax=Cudoniella acicularis TaxID=354080 RepID=A0A8H4RUL0_9HELO|nr:hypothetical protein G7Y89_g2217 [Cudoniella acicularis]
MCARTILLVHPDCGHFRRSRETSLIQCQQAREKDPNSACLDRSGISVQFLEQERCDDCMRKDETTSEKAANGKEQKTDELNKGL